MNVELTEIQQQALDAQLETPLQVVDPRTNELYVLLKAKDYEWIKALFDLDRPTVAEQRHLLRRAGLRAGWDDPDMDVYNELDPRKLP